MENLSVSQMALNFSGSQTFGPFELKWSVNLLKQSVTITLFFMGSEIWQTTLTKDDIEDGFEYSAFGYTIKVNAKANFLKMTLNIHVVLTHEGETIIDKVVTIPLK